jgi:aldehyde:ferredoxin oxidoreductase
VKLIKVNMGGKSINMTDVPQKYGGLGGRGLTSIMISNEVPPAGG